MLPVMINIDKPGFYAKMNKLTIKELKLTAKFVQEIETKRNNE